MKHLKIYELVQSDFDPIETFYLKDVLNPKIWDGFKIKSKIRKQLLDIANDFYDELDLDTPMKDIILIGSLSNYNWSHKYSDYDLHILLDFNDINEDTDLVRSYFDAIKKLWNDKYDIFIEGYEVEIYVQDVGDPYISNGIFSLLNNDWIAMPSKNNFKIDEDEIRNKSKYIMSYIDDIEENFYNYTNEELDKKTDKVWKKIKKYRKEGLEEKDGEFSTGNFIFKLLRRNGYIGKLLSLKTKSYENKFE